MEAKAAAYLRQRSQAAGRPAVGRDVLIFVLGLPTARWWLQPEEASDWMRLGVLALLPVVAFELGLYAWRFVWVVPKQMHMEGLGQIARLEHERDKSLEELRRREALELGASTWRQLGDRFRRMGPYLEAFRHLYDSGRISWSLLCNSSRGRRAEQEFRTEAQVAAGMLKRSGYQFAPTAGEEMEDVWLEAVFSLVPPASAIDGSGVDEHGHHTSTHVSNLAEACAVACAHFAAMQSTSGTAVSWNA